MAELALKIGDTPTYKDGDILCAFNRRRIRCTHAQHICHPKLAGGGVGVHRDNSHVARDWFEHTAEYRFERVSHWEMLRTVIATGESVMLSNVPKDIEGKLCAIDVPLYIQRRLAHPRHRIFGTLGAEVWYGGRTDVSHAALDLVWNAIETKTPKRESDHTLWPVGTRDLYDNLFVSIDDFDEVEAETLVAPDAEVTGVDENGNDIVTVFQKRRMMAAWREVPGLPVAIAAIEDHGKAVDIRASVAITRAIERRIKAKPRP